VRGEIDRLCDRRIADGIVSTPLIGDYYFSRLQQILDIDVRFGFAMINLGRANRRIVIYFSAHGADFQVFSVECRRNVVARKGATDQRSSSLSLSSNRTLSRKGCSAGFTIARAATAVSG